MGPGTPSTACSETSAGCEDRASSGRCSGKVYYDLFRRVADGISRCRSSSSTFPPRRDGRAGARPGQVVWCQRKPPTWAVDLRAPRFESGLPSSSTNAGRWAAVLRGIRQPACCVAKRAGFRSQLWISLSIESAEALLSGVMTQTSLFPPSAIDTEATVAKWMKAWATR
jgi:hypothetical protein